jgi:hypothetical protein
LNLVFPGNHRIHEGRGSPDGGPTAVSMPRRKGKMLYDGDMFYDNNNVWLPLVPIAGYHVASIVGGQNLGYLGSEGSVSSQDDGVHRAGIVR